MDECTSTPCTNNATCADSNSNDTISINSYQCGCDKGFANGWCSYVDYIAEYARQCTVFESDDEPVFGGNCDLDVNECDSSPCKNGATCSESTTMEIGTVGYHTYRCTCVAGYADGFCQYSYIIPYEEQCSVLHTPEKTKNISDSLKELAGSCGIDVDECASIPCDNGATCSDSTTTSDIPGYAASDIHTYRCSCAAGYGNGWCEYDFIAEYSALCTLSDSGHAVMYAHGTAHVTAAAVADRITVGATDTVTYLLVFRLNEHAHSLHAMFGSESQGAMHFPAAYSFDELAAAFSEGQAECDTPWFGGCADLLLENNAARYASYFSLSDVMNTAVAATNVDGTSWNSDTALAVTDGAVHRKDTSSGCTAAECPIARLTVNAGSAFMAWANLQGHTTASESTSDSHVHGQSINTGDMHQSRVWIDRVWFSPVTGCGLDVVECASNPCKHGAKCSDSTTNAAVSIGSYRCSCVAGFANGWCDYDDYISEYHEHCQVHESDDDVSS